MDIEARMRSGEPCFEATGELCRVRDARSGCACIAAADEIARLRALLDERDAERATLRRALNDVLGKASDALRATT
jgi:hypothetical protein